MAKQLTRDEIVGYLEDTCRSIETGDFRYSDWDRCVCGHTRLVVTGKRAPMHNHITTPGMGTQYEQVLTAMANTEFVRRCLGNKYELLELFEAQASQSAFRVSEAYAQFCKKGGEVNGPWRGQKPLRTSKTSAVDFIDRVIEEIKGMNIGKEMPARTITPIEEPVPDSVPERETIPSRERESSPERAPEKVPSR